MEGPTSEPTGKEDLPVGEGEETQTISKKTMDYSFEVEYENYQKEEDEYRYPPEEDSSSMLLRDGDPALKPDVQGELIYVVTVGNS